MTHMSGSWKRNESMVARASQPRSTSDSAIGLVWTTSANRPPSSTPNFSAGQRRSRPVLRTGVLAADTPEDRLGITSRMNAPDDDQEPILQTVQNLEWKLSHETTACVTVENLAGFWEVEQRGQGGIESTYELRAQADALRFIPLKGGRDIVYGLIKKPDRASRLSRQGAP
jgi:hypothetical protein